MMFKGLKKSTSKITAAVLAVVMLLTLIPFGTLVNAFAATVDSYTVTLTDGSSTIRLDGVEITLTNKEDASKSWTQTTVNGIATFENCVEVGTTYTASVAEKTGYEAVADFEIAPVAGETNKDILFTEIEKITISGKIVDENAQAYRGATVHLSGYLEATTTTNDDGEYFFEVYKGKTYKVEATANEDKYEKAVTDITNPTAEYTCNTLKLNIKKFNITTSAAEHGTITSSESNIEYGSVRTITITADEGYRIDTLIGADATDAEKAHGAQEYSFAIENITEDKIISVTFYRQTYTVSFDVSANGKVTYNTDQTAEGGKVTAVTVDENGTVDFKAIANSADGYHIKEVRIGDDIKLENGKNDNIEYADTVPEVTRDVTVTVVFDINTYAVTINNGENGTATVDKEEVNHNGSAVVTITPDTGYNIEKVTINGIETDAYAINDESSYTLNINNITENKNVVVEYSEILSITLDNIAINSSDALKTVEDNDVIAYIYAKNGEATFTTTKNGIRINGDRSTGIAYRTQTWKITESTLVTKIEVYNGRKWENITLNKNIQIVIDTKAPVVKPDSDELAWTNHNNVTISGSVTDENTTERPSSGLSYIVWSKDAPLTKDAVLTATENKVVLGADGKYNFTSVDGEQDATYYIYAVDISGNVSTAETVKVKIDTKRPKVQEFKFSTKVNNIVQDIISFLTFGTICSEKMYVTVVANDETITSGLKEITLYRDGVELATKQVTENYAIFELKESEFENGAEVSAVVTDIAGNASDITKPTDTGALSNEVKIDGSTKPVATITPASSVYTDATGNLWYDGNLALTVVAKDENTGIREVNIKLNGKDITKDINNKAINTNFSTSCTTEETFVINTSQNPREGENVLEVVVTNNAGVKSDKTVQKVYIDTTSPTKKNGVDVTFKDKYDSPAAKVIHFLSFGSFCNEAVEIKVTADDEALTNGSPNSGIKSIQLFKSGTSEEVTLDKGKTDTFTVELGFEGTFTVLITDNVGNTLGEQLITEKNSNMKDANGYVMLEEVAPSVSDLVDAPLTDVRKQDGTHNYSGDAEIKFSAQDTGAGLYSVVVKLNGDNYPNSKEHPTVFPVTFAQQDRARHEYTLSTKDIEPDENGKYAFVVTVTDNAGNVTEKELTLEKDLSSPTITGFDFSLTSNSDNVSVEDCITVEDYGYYFKEGVTVKVSAKDGKADKAKEMVSGVKSITVVLLDKDGRYYTVNAEGNVVPIDNLSEAVAHTSLINDTFTFDIVEDFKGQVFAFATDNVGNTPTSTETFVWEEDVKKDGELKGYKFPNGSVLESAEKHEATSSIEIKAPEKTATQNESYTYTYGGSAQQDTVMSYEDAQKVPLYNANPTFELVVKDEYSGIKEIKVTIIENGVETVKTLSIDNAGKKGGDDVDAWTIKKEAKTNKEAETNLVTSAERQIEVNGNFNNMVILVELTDRAGNSSYDYYAFGIDKTKPVIEVTYDNNAADEVYPHIYKADRTATVKITERNFNSEDVVYNITNTDGVIPQLTGWEEHLNAENPDETYYLASIAYAADGDYTFDISCSDLAKNPADAFTQHTFTIDKTLPTIAVSYDNTAALNGNYYKADRIATVTIVEHNFDSARVNVIGTATDNGTDLSFPVISSWADNGDTHIATIHYSFDARFTFDIECLDMAGNSIADYTAEEFVVDKTAPTLEISGVEDRSANNGTVAPIVTCTDTNFNPDTVTITLNGVKNGNGLGYSRLDQDIPNGREYAYADFDKVQEVDDMYTLSATLTDKAGNETTKEIMFSANRFGSVYTFDTYLKGIEGKYTNAEQDIVFTETNVDTLNHESILLKLFKDGTPTDLQEGQDYTVTHTGGDGKWSQYEYVVNKALYANDGKYRMTVYSVDRAGNVNESIEESKQAEISFGIDKTKPVIVPIDFESGKQYPVEVKTVKAEIKDNLVLENVKIYLGEEKAENEIQYAADGETYTFDIPQSNEKQTVIFVATDAASNEYKLAVEDFLVSTNIFVRWYNNTLLFAGSIIGVVVLAVGLAAFLIFGKKKKKDEEDGQEQF